MYRPVNKLRKWHSIDRAFAGPYLTARFALGLLENLQTRPPRASSKRHSSSHFIASNYFFCRCNSIFAAAIFIKSYSIDYSTLFFSFLPLRSFSAISTYIRSNETTANGSQAITQSVPRLSKLEYNECDRSRAK